MKDKETKYAFPCDTISEDYSGMTLRDYFAAKAMQVILKHQIDRGNLAKGFAEFCVTELSYDTADAMIKQREL